MTADQINLLAALPEDGTLRPLKKEEYQTAMALWEQRPRCIFLIAGVGPAMLASLTYEGRKVLRHVR